MAPTIYQKTCPACASMVPRESEVCDCGYNFTTASIDADADSAHDEELYLNYLIARIDQLVADVDAARAALAERPSSFERALAVMRAVSILRAARDDVATQEEKIRAIAGGAIKQVDEPAAIPASADDASATHADAPGGVFGAQPLSSVLSHEPGAAFRALQAARAAQVMVSEPRECPNCHAHNPPAATRCACGYALAPAALPEVEDTPTRDRPPRK